MRVYSRLPSSYAGTEACQKLMHANVRSWVQCHGSVTLENPITTSTSHKDFVDLGRLGGLDQVLVVHGSDSKTC